jgi:low affinity Fe/Cu permease|tara:strand:+ start:76 stop:228 length:153 start_codon:yes stop_codon:yes gene_type:complete
MGSDFRTDLSHHDDILLSEDKIKELEEKVEMLENKIAHIIDVLNLQHDFN